MFSSSVIGGLSRPSETSACAMGPSAGSRNPYESPAVWVSRLRMVMPCSTLPRNMGVNEGIQRVTGSSNPIMPWSAKARAATLTMALLMEASRKRVSRLMALPFSRSAMPTARWYTTCPSRAATTTAPTICCCARALCSTASRRPDKAASADTASGCAASAEGADGLAALALITAGPQPDQTPRVTTSVTKRGRPRSLSANPHRHFNIRAMLPPKGECALATPAD